MAHNSHAEVPEVPAEIVANRREGWHAFTRATVYTCVSLAALLLLMLVFFKVIY